MCGIKDYHFQALVVSLSSRCFRVIPECFPDHMSYVLGSGYPTEVMLFEPVKLRTQATSIYLPNADCYSFVIPRLMLLFWIPHTIAWSERHRDRTFQKRCINVLSVKSP